MFPANSAIWCALAIAQQCNTSACVSFDTYTACLYGECTELCVSACNSKNNTHDDATYYCTYIGNVL